MASINVIELKANSEEEFVISSRKKVRIGNFDSIGKGEPTQRFVNGEVKEFTPVCLYDVVARHKDRSTVIWFLMALLKNRDYTSNLSFLDPKDKSEANAISLAYKILREEEIIVRVKPKTYMISPYMIYPLFKYFDLIEEQWIKALEK